MNEDSTTLLQRIESLELIVADHEQHLEAVDKALYRSQQDNAALKTKLDLLQQRMQRLSDDPIKAFNPADDVPPHY